MSDYNYTKQPEPVVTVKKELFSKNGVLLLLVLVIVAVGAGAFWKIATQPLPVPVVEEVAEMPLSEVETSIYRETLERISPEVISDSASEIIEVSESAVVDVSPESTQYLIDANNQETASLPPETATVVDLSSFIAESATVAEENSVPVSQTAYLQGDVTMIDFQIDEPDMTGAAVQLTGTIQSNDASTKNLLITSGGNIYTLKTNSAKITTQDGKMLSQSNIKKDDIVTVNGTLLQSGPIILVQTLTLIGVQEYLVDF
jgi:hypothetical protein